MGERRGTKALELWCRRITEGYPGVNVQNMTTSWRDGLAFCAMIHHFRPDLIDFNSLNKDDVYRNNELAFRTAEQHLGIPALLDAEDMASCSVPDRLSILTYLSQFYQTFGGSSPSRSAMNRTTETTDERIAPVPESPKPKVASRLGMRRDPCAVCGLPVFLAEKLMIARIPYHRTCFRCARCNNQLTPGNYYETEESQYCCETCPDEETSTLPPSMHLKYNEAIILGGSNEKISEEGTVTNPSYQRSLSDEEKTGSRTHDTYTPGSRRQDSSVPDLIAQTSQLRLNFMASHLLSEKNDGDQDGSQEDEELSRSAKDLHVSPKQVNKRIDGAFSDGDENDEHGEEEYEEEEDDEEEEEESSSSTDSSIESQSRRKIEDTGGDLEKDDVHNTLDDNVDTKRNKEQRLTAISFHDVVKDKSVSLICKVDDTKEPLSQAGDCEDSDRGLSLVQKRLRMFEAQDKKDQVERKNKVHVKSVGVPEGKVQAKECSMIAVKDEETVQTNVQSSADVERDDKVDVLKNNKTEITNEDSSEVRPASPDKGDLSKVSQIISSTENTSRTSIKNLKEDGDEEETDDGTTIAERLTSLDIQTSTVAMAVDGNNESNVEETSVNSVKNTSLTTMEGIDLSDNDNYPEDLNPFREDIEDENTAEKCPTTMDSSKSSRISKNPFESDEEEEEEKDMTPPKPAARSNVSSNRAKQPLVIDVPIKRRLAAPQINLNPFWSDDDDHDSDLECKEHTPGNVPVPKPRTIKHTPELGRSQKKSELNRSGLYASNSSITSSESATTPSGTYRKKKPAPPPPTVKELFSSGQRTPLKAFNSSPGYNGTSPRTMPRAARKTKPAPPPPLPTSTPYNTSIGAPLKVEASPISESHEISESHNMWEDEKTNKDETNRNRQSLTSSCGDNVEYKSYPDKSVHGKWKRKKGPAPPRPMPHRRKIKVMSLKDVKLELDEIELQQQGLERQGVRIEQLIRDKCESGSRIDDTSLSIDVEELVLELFSLVNEKNELFRRQAELMLLRRQQRLEEEHAEVEYQIRCLMSQPEATKTDFEKQREEALIQRLIEIVERRNEIVECLEMDRRREVEEDRSINKHMGLFAARNKSEIFNNDNNDSHSSKTKKTKTKEKGKEKKSKKTPKKDADKDVDETEVKLKRHSKRKWF